MSHSLILRMPLGVVTYNTVQGEIPAFSGYNNCDRDRNKFNTEIKEQIKTSLLVQNQERWSDHVKHLVLQGRFLEIAEAEKEDMIWKSYMFDLKQGTLKFLLNACIDTLPTAANLQRWKKSTTDQCKLCRARETTCHILNNCPVSLQNGIYLWRHNNIVNYVMKLLASTLCTQTYQGSRRGQE